MTQVLDTNHDVSNRLAALQAAGVKTVIRYIGSTSNPDKYIHAEEARRIGLAGMKLACVFEIWGGADNFSHGDITAANGARYGAFAKQWMETVGAPRGAAVYFAIDTDASDIQIRNVVLPFFQAAKQALGPDYRMGVYGCGAVCAAVLDGGLASLAWLSNAMGWNGSRAFRDSKRWVLLQHLPATIAGLDTDPDDVLPTANGQLADIGDFVPFSGALPPPAPAPQPVHDAFWLQSRLNALGAVPTLAVDGDIGPRSVAAIEKYLPA